MNNEQYLVISYFTVCAACLCLAFATFLILRRSFGELTRAVPGGGPGLLMRKLFLLGLALSAAIGFFSVTYQSCEKTTYQQIIADRAYLLAKNQEQLAASLRHIAFALLAWGLLLAAAASMTRHKKRNSEGSGHM
ncbi:MAG: hypothetical protein ACM3X6_07410 [Patescibacteria group bacterium]